MNLIPNWRRAWRLTSVQAAALLAVLSALQADVLPMLHGVVPVSIWPWVTAGFGAAIVLLRVLAQPAVTGNAPSTGDAIDPAALVPPGQRGAIGLRSLLVLLALAAAAVGLLRLPAHQVLLAIELALLAVFTGALLYVLSSPGSVPEHPLLALRHRAARLARRTRPWALAAGSSLLTLHGGTAVSMPAGTPHPAMPAPTPQARR